MNREQVLKIVDNCFHYFASSNRYDAKERANKLIDNIEDVKKLSLCGVSNRRELLIDYHKFLTDELSLDIHNEVWVDEYIKHN